MDEWIATKKLSYLEEGLVFLNLYLSQGDLFWHQIELNISFFFWITVFALAIC